MSLIDRILNKNKKSMIIESVQGKMVTSDLFYRSLFHHHPDIVFSLDLRGNLLEANHAFSNILGYSKDEIYGSFHRFFPTEEIPHVENLYNKATHGEAQNYETLLIHKDGHIIEFNITIIPMAVNEQITGIYGIAKEIGEEKRLKRLLQERKQLYESLFEHHPDGVSYFDVNGIFIDCNTSFEKLFGYSKTRLIQSSFDFLVHKDYLKDTWNGFFKALRGNPQRYEIVCVHSQGHEVCLDVTNLPIMIDGQIAGVFAIVKEKMKDLNKHLAYHDALTNLPNRRLFEERLEQAIVIGNTLQQKMAVMYLDMDRFKYINDTLGHSIGDKLLTEIAKRLQECIKDHDVLARMGGDEFTVILSNIKDTNQVVTIAKSMITSLEKPFLIEDYELYITTSIGMSLYPNDGEDSQTLMKNADSALHRAKEQGKNTYHIYTPSLNVQTYKIFTLERDLRKAIENKELELYYQPMVHAISGDIVGVEALIRWNHPEWGMVSPDEFIPLAEETGLILKLSRWVKEATFYQNKAWQKAGLPAIPISINLSAHRFLHKDILKNVSDFLNESNLDPQYLQFEITETILMENQETVLSILSELKKMGVKIALDDFGTGYSSLAYLKQFKEIIDTIKIDRSFIHDLQDEDTQYILSSIVDLAHHLNMSVVAEGVENQEQLNISRKFKCDIIQGFIFSEAVPADRFETLLKMERLEPIETMSEKTDKTFENQREFFRVQLDFPLSASMTVTHVKGKKVELGSTEVLIEDIGIGGLRFLSQIKLAVHKDIILEFETRILDKWIQMHGAIVWQRQAQSDIYQYGLEFMISENERTSLTRTLNDFPCNYEKVHLSRTAILLRLINIIT
ncbi:bifunctional diguanylate cyclase/phosphodiesterase [Ammoniphilus resinae]|uniref:Diguanylate cyclase (GGDEF)-like protein/PAS domain S-box-containing protein n=1 Tax=Ammoniphilus resinae TaxID=861532 RepID=A0ABS4GNL5_9BACL|nr:bifunctional diguanylate cyclase/phosphodiesterase [Ammoniphilus resinae]MBP1931839.1 diguanylate cyclase (GGDEF)-like protein/PAS domain S-box-containing protein [Ammoniphilus resinae]